MAALKEPTCEEAVEELAEFCRRHDLPWTDQSQQRFVDYLELLEQFNNAMNLIGPLKRRQIVRELLIDSVAPAVLAPPAGSILDIGSGAGLPGIPLKILYPALPTTLVEPRKKRSTFLRIVANRLAFEDVTVVPGRIEDADVPFHDYVISKAFRPPADWIDTAADYVAPGGLIVCLHASEGTEAARSCAAHHQLTEVAHAADVEAELVAPTPQSRAITVFRRS